MKQGAENLDIVMVRQILVLGLLILLSSCYVRPVQLYIGRDTLPEKNSSSMGKGFQRVPRVYQVKRLPPPEISQRPEVEEAIKHFTSKDKRYIPLAYKRRAEYLATLQQIFHDEGIPVELLNLALIESGFRKSIRSPRGAVGLWQFMKGTARSYGLKVSFLEDERKDPILSTIAAARMLRDLYETYEDWPLALAAYNAGPARVDRALVRSGSNDYWELIEKKALSRETRRFVPRIFAAIVIEKNPEKFGLTVAEGKT